MKYLYLGAVALILLSFTDADEIATRGGGGGRGGAARGESHPAAGARANPARASSLHRTPSMSREGHAPARKTSQRIQPQASKTPGRASQVIAGQLPASHAQLKQSFSPRQHLATNSSKVQNFAKNYPRQQANAKQMASRVQSRVQHAHPSMKQWFSHDFYQNRGLNPNFYHSGLNAWRAANWAGVSSWLTWESIDPIYYDDEGYSYTVPSSDLVESDATYGEAEEPQRTSEIGNWLPLGVFAIGQSEAQAATSRMFLQLMLSKEGTIAGTYYNTATNQALSLEGIVDEQTQQVVWRIANNPRSPVMQTGLYNLTQDVVPASVTFPNGTEQAWQLVRIRQ